MEFTPVRLESALWVPAFAGMSGERAVAVWLKVSSRPERSGEPGAIVKVSGWLDGSRIALRASGMTSGGWCEAGLCVGIPEKRKARCCQRACLLWVVETERVRSTLSVL